MTIDISDYKKYKTTKAVSTIKRSRNQVLFPSRMLWTVLTLSLKFSTLSVRDPILISEWTLTTPFSWRRECAWPMTLVTSSQEPSADQLALLMLQLLRKKKQGRLEQTLSWQQKKVTLTYAKLYLQNASDTLNMIAAWDVERRQFPWKLMLLASLSGGDKNRPYNVAGLGASPSLNLILDITPVCWCLIYSYPEFGLKR